MTDQTAATPRTGADAMFDALHSAGAERSEEHTSELQSH